MDQCEVTDLSTRSNYNKVNKKQHFKTCLPRQDMNKSYIHTTVRKSTKMKYIKSKTIPTENITKI